MSTWAIEDSVGVRWATLTRGRLVPRVVAVGAMAGAVTAQQLATDADLWPGLVLVVGALLTMAAPDSGRGLLCLLGYGACWLVADGKETTVWVLVAGLCLLGFHSAVAWAAAGPVGTVADRRVVRAWVSDTLLVGGATVGVWLLAVVLHGATASPEVLLAVTLVLLLGLGWLTRGDPAPTYAEPARRDTKSHRPGSS